jgi:hypothetical protein
VLGRRHVEDRLRSRGKLGLEIVQLVDQQGWRCRALVHEVRIGFRSVDRRRVGLRDRLVVERDAHTFDRAPCDHGGLLRRPRRVAHERAQRSAGDEERSCDDEEDAEHGPARVPEQPAEDQVERLAGRTAPRLAEDGHDAEPEHDEPGAERPHIDELGTGDHEPAEDDEDEGDADPAVAHEAFEPGVDPVADVASVPSEPEGDGEKDAQEREREPEKLVMLLPAPAAACALLLAHARGGLRA